MVLKAHYKHSANQKQNISRLYFLYFCSKHNSTITKKVRHLVPAVSDNFCCCSGAKFLKLLLFQSLLLYKRIWLDYFMISHILSDHFPLKASSKSKSLPSCYSISLAHNAVLQASSITEAYDVSGHHSARETALDVSPLYSSILQPLYSNMAFLFLCVSVQLNKSIQTWLFLALLHKS